MSQEQIGLVGGIVGALIGLAGGIVGSYLSIKNAKTPEERSFIIWSIVGLWLAGFIFIVIPMILEARAMLPSWVTTVGTVILMLGLGPVIAFINKRCEKLGREKGLVVPKTGEGAEKPTSGP